MVEDPPARGAGRACVRLGVRYSTTRDEIGLGSGPGGAPVRVAGHGPGAAFASRSPHARPDPPARHLQGAGGDQHHRLGRRHHRGRARDGGPAPGRRLRRGRHAARRPARRPEEGQPGGAAQGQRREEAAAPAGPPRRGRGEARGLGARSLQAGRGRRLLLRARLGGRQGHGRDLRGQPDPLQEGRLRAGSRPDPGADRGRGARIELAVERGELAPEARSRPDRGGARAERGRRSRDDARGAARAACGCRPPRR